MPSWALPFGARPLQCQDNVVALGDLKSFSFDQLVKFNLQKCSSDSDCAHTVPACLSAGRPEQRCCQERALVLHPGLPAQHCDFLSRSLCLCPSCIDSPTFPPAGAAARSDRIQGSSAWLHTGSYQLRCSPG